MVKDYKGDPAAVTGETFDASPANLEARTQRFTLPNGMKVALLPKKTRGGRGAISRSRCTTPTRNRRSASRPSAA